MPLDDDRLIRVFVSSTFQDMHEERDHLIKNVFPSIRSLCRSRGVTFAEIDLRWGITESRAERRELIPILLNEIDRCRPFFIGILGERYGWTPARQELPFLREDAFRWLDDWLRIHSLCSVTEMEIRHGVLNQPKLAKHALFYFRDPAFSEGIDAFREVPHPDEIESLGLDKAAELAGARADHLARLKAEIRETTRQHDLSLVENYRDPEQLGHFIEQDLREIVDRLYPDRGWTVRIDPLDREAAEHNRFAKSRTGVYIRREAYFQELNDHLAGYSSPLVVVGDTGSGKSALLANWAIELDADVRKESDSGSIWKRVARRFRPDPGKKTGKDEYFFAHFIGATPQSTDWSYLMWRIMSELKNHFALRMDLPTTRRDQRIEFPKWLQKCSEQAERIVIIIDALNQLEDREGALDLVWLPKRMPENVRMVVSTLPGRPLDELKSRQWPVLEIEPLGRVERRQMAKEYLKAFGKEFSENQLARIVDPPTHREETSNPLFLKVLLDELRLCRYETIDERLAAYLEATSIPDLFRRILDRLEADYDTAERPFLVRDALTTIWASRRGLQEHELLLILGDGINPMPGHHWSLLYAAASESFVDRDGLINFFHDGFRLAVQEKFLPDERARRRAHLELADYCETCEMNERKLDEFPWQLAKAGAWERLARLLSDPAFFLPAYRANPRDLRFFWSEIEQHGDIRMVDIYREVINEPAMNAAMVPDLTSLLSDMGKAEEAGRLRKHLVDSARRTASNELELVDALIDEAFHLREIHKLKESMDRLEEALEILEFYQDDLRLAECLSGKSIILAAWGEYEEAIELLNRQKTIAERHNDPILLLRALGNLSHIKGRQGLGDEQVSLLDQAEQLARRTGSWTDLATTLHNRATICLARKDFEGALRYAFAHEELCRDRNLPTRLILAIQYQGEILQKKGDDEKALECFERASEACRLSTNPVRKVQLLSQRCEILKKQGRLDEVGTLQDEKIAILRKVENSDELIETLTEKARFVLDQLDDAEKGAEALIELLDSLDENQVEIRLPCLVALAEVERFQSPDDAVAHLNEALPLAQASEDIPNLRDIFDNLFEIYRETHQWDKALEVVDQMEAFCSGHDDRLDDYQVAKANRGLILEDMGRLEEALDSYVEQEAFCRAHDTLAHGIQWSLARQAHVLDQMDRLEEAAAKSESRIEICRRPEVREKLPAALLAHAQILDRLGSPEKAIEHYRNESAIYREEKNYDALQQCLCDQANVYYRLEQFDKAIPIYREQEAICREHNLRQGLRTSLFNQYLIHQRQGKDDAALSCLLEEEGLCRELEQKENLAANLYNQALLHKKQDRFEENLAALEKMESHCREHQLEKRLTDCLFQQARLLQSTGQPDASIKVYQKLEETARTFGQRDHLQVALSELALSMKEKGESSHALDLLKEQESICREESYHNALQACLCDQGNIYLSQGDLETASELYIRQEDLCRRKNLTAGLRVSLHNQHIVLSRQGNKEKASELIKEEEELCRELKLDHELAACLYTQAVSSIDRGEWRDAEIKLEESIGICRKVDDNQSLREHLAKRASVHLGQEQFDEALETLKEAEPLCREHGDPNALQLCLYQQGQALEKLERKDEAFAIYREMEEHCKTNQLHKGHQAALGALGRLSIESGQMDEGRDLLDQQIVICRTHGFDDDLAHAIRIKGVYRYRQGKLNDALTMLEEAESVARRIDRPSLLAMILENKASVYHELKNTDAALSALRECESIYTEHGEGKQVLNFILKQYNLLCSEEERREEALTIAKHYEAFAAAHPEMTTELNQILGQQGSLLNQLGRHEEALETHRREAECYRAEGDQGGFAGALISQGVVLEAIDRKDEAFNLYQEAEKISRIADHRILLEMTLYNQGYYHQSNHNYSDALLCYGEAEACARADDNHEAVYRISMRQTEVYLALGQYDSALACCREAVDAAKDMQTELEMADALISLGMCHVELEDFDPALDAYRQAEAIYRKLDNPFGIHLAEVDIADVLLRTGDFENALVLCQRTELYFEETGDKDLLSAALGNQAQVRARQGHTSLARELHERELKLARESDNIEVLVSTLFYSSESYLKDLNDSDTANALIEEGLELAKDKGMVGWEKKLLQLGNSLPNRGTKS